MKNTKAFLGIFAGLVASLLLAANMKIFAQNDLSVINTPAVAVDPAIKTVSAGSAFQVQVVVTDVANLGGFQFTLNFDPALAQASGASLGSFLSGGSPAFIALGPNINNTTGSITFGAYSFGSSGVGLNGSGVLANVNMSATTPGQSALALSNVILADPSAHSITATTQNGLLIINGIATATPTVSSTPTTTPTSVPSSTPTNTPINTPTSTPANTSTSTPTSAPTDTPTSAPTWTPTNTSTLTPTYTSTSTPTNTPTSTRTATPTPTNTSVQLKYKVFIPLTMREFLAGW